jgi:DNA-directed RNA polymerase subunit M/transcription elongation factor TFIIS
MSTAPNISTLKQSVSTLKTGNPENQFLSEEFVDFLFSINVDGKSIIKNNNEGKFELLELAYLVGREGEDIIMQLIEANKNLSLTQIIRKSNVFIKARRRFFMDTTVELKEKKKIASIVKCPKCHSNEVETKTVQIRAGDEASTDKNICRKCNYKFSIN